MGRMLFLSLILMSSQCNAGVTDFWKSCDDKWVGYWKSFKDKPACEPKDKWLKKYSDGEKGHLKAQELEKRLSLVEIGKYKYGRGNDLNTNMSLMVEVSNKGNKVLEKLTLNCTIDINNAIRIHDGVIDVFPRLIPNGSAYFNMYVNFSFLYGGLSREAYGPEEKNRYIDTSRVNGSMENVSISCKKRDVNFNLF